MGCLKDTPKERSSADEKVLWTFSANDAPSKRVFRDKRNEIPCKQGTYRSIVLNGDQQGREAVEAQTQVAASWPLIDLDLDVCFGLPSLRT